MSRRRRVISPRIVVPHGAGLWFLIVLLILGAVGGAFLGGVLLAREEAKSLELAIAQLEQEREAVAQSLADARQEKIVLERTLQIDREASRSARENLKMAQDARLVLEKEASLLKRLIREDGGGVLKVQDVVVKPGEEEGMFHYQLTLTQMIQEFGDSKGTLGIKLAGKREGKDVVVSLADLPGSDPKSQKFNFQHFQTIEGTIAVPDDLAPDALVIEVEPTSKNLLRATETVPWDQGA
jgi:hypothetical protein